MLFLGFFGFWERYPRHLSTRAYMYSAFVPVYTSLPSVSSGEVSLRPWPPSATGSNSPPSVSLSVWRRLGSHLVSLFTCPLGEYCVAAYGIVIAVQRAKLIIRYKRYELASRFSIYYTATAVSGAFSGLLAGVITQYLDGARGYKGWQWLFVRTSTHRCYQPY